MLKSKRAVYAIVMLLIVVSSILGTVFIVKNNKKLDGYVKTNAVVVGHKHKIEFDYDDDEYETMYSEVVEYTVDGKQYTANNPVWSNAPKGIGREIEIAYDPNMPSRCEFVKSSYFPSIICFCFAGVGLLSLIAIVFRDVKEAKNNY